MRIVLLGVLIGAGLTVAAWGASPGSEDALNRRAAENVPGQAADGLIAFSTIVDGKYQQLSVIDSKRMAISVYHIELATGAVELKCVRTIHWDLQMTCYNGKGLLPQEIHSLQEHPR